MGAMERHSLLKDVVATSLEAQRLFCSGSTFRLWLMFGLFGILEDEIEIMVVVEVLPGAVLPKV